MDFYRAENNELQSEFVASRDKFVSAVNNLILCSKNHDDSNSRRDYDNLKESCDECHEIFKKELEGELKIDDLTKTSPTNE
ncbi:MAG: cytochrome c [Candidatus Brocadiales bacterium]|nr:cytochrome c [Candidatus Brocadiales bacterium]